MKQSIGTLWSKCGAPMRPKNYLETRLHTDGSRSFAYLCSCKEKSHGKLCNEPNVHGNTLDELVVNEILKYLEPDSKVNQLLKDLQNRIRKDNKAEGFTE
ncbi:MAG: recombinase zinc beta ribbon domain-containing protein [Clostridiales bacterium]|nr:recombinase zinc beta ribbon domain-containing protein [Clostridiales bacterium]